MANEIITSSVQFEWIFDTDIQNMDQLLTFIWAIYNDANERLETYDQVIEEQQIPPLAEFIPTKAMILDTADMEFMDHYLHLIHRGNCDGWENQYQQELEEDGDWDEIRASMEEMRYNSGAFYMGLMDGDPEMEYAKDVMRGLQLFNLTYLDDMVNTDVYRKEFADGYEWINPPIVKVW